MTIYDVAREVGVSIASVSRVLHGQEGVSSATRERVRSVIERTGYVANGAARGLAGRRLGVLGFVDNALDNRALQRYFAADPVSWAARTYLSMETMSLG